jgi:hypothetical protein
MTVTGQSPSLLIGEVDAQDADLLRVRPERRMRGAAAIGSRDGLVTD